MEQQSTEQIWYLMARKLSGEATPMELAELEVLFRSHPEANYSMEVMEDIWKSRIDTDRQHAENEYRKLSLKLQQLGLDEGRFGADDHYIGEATPAATPKRPFIFTGVLLIICLCLAGGIYLSNNRKTVTPAAETEAVAKNQISTRYGSKTSLVLPDGTKVWLNAGSVLTYAKDYGNSQREVQLSGEAFFDVVHNPAKPFYIHTGKMDIKVLGTAFNVKCYPEEKQSETSLIRGSIEITLKDRAEKIVLKPNEKIILTDNMPLIAKLKAEARQKAQEPVSALPIITLGYLTREPVNNEIIETSWVDNRLLFSNETFEEIAVKMQRWYAVNISFTNDKLKQKRFTGTFENETVAEALSAMQLTTTFHFTVNKDQIILSP